MTSTSSEISNRSNSQDSPVRMEREIPLNFWLGPKKLFGVKFMMSIEDSEINPFEVRSSKVTKNPYFDSNLEGIYRPSEPIFPEDPVLSITNSEIRYIEKDFQRRFINLEEKFETYMSKFSGKTRSSLRRKVRKFEKASGGKIEWVMYKNVEEMEEFHALARKISRLTYQEKIFDAGIPETQEFVERMKALARKDNVRCFILFFSGKPISYLYLPVLKGRVIYEFLGFNPAFSKHSPGSVLQLLALELLFSEKRYRIFDFTEGDGAHKKLFSTSECYCGNVYYLKGTMKNRFIIRMHLSLRIISNLMDSIVVKSGLKVRLRKILRGQGG